MLRPIEPGHEPQVQRVDDLQARPGRGRRQGAPRAAGTDATLRPARGHDRVDADRRTQARLAQGRGRRRLGRRAAPGPRGDAGDVRALRQRPRGGGRVSAVRLAVLAFVAVAACEPAKRDAGAAAGQSAARPPKSVRVVAAVAAALPTKVAVSGLLAAQEELVLGMEVGGRLASLACDVGDAVAAGQLLAALDERDFQLAIERAEAAVVAAEARLGLGPDAPLDRFDLERAPSVREAQAVVVEAQLNRERVAKLVEGSLQAAAQLETATAVLAVAENRLQRARDDVRTWLAEAQLRRIERTQAQKRLRDAQVKAPWAGRVAVRHVAAGQVVQAGAAVVTLLRTEPLRLRMRVPDRLAFGIAAGQRVEFTVDGADGVDRAGVVVRVGPAIDRDDRTRLVEAEVGNADGE
ncbi:MAG: HlyD family efflux transporter periplasmic adaptor subunit, partial [Planctomycetes bacterium]|nr:HlyD family efflux transporter periplasmic adaptor subunit [Planctomycetota bacterium]